MVISDPETSIYAVWTRARTLLESQPMKKLSSSVLAIVALALVTSTVACGAPTDEEAVGTSTAPLLSTKQKKAHAVRSAVHDLRQHVQQRPAATKHAAEVEAISAKVDTLAVNAERLARAVGLSASDATTRSLHGLYYPPEDNVSVSALVELVMFGAQSIGAATSALQRQFEADMAAAVEIQRQTQLELVKEREDRQNVTRMLEWLNEVDSGASTVQHNWPACWGPC